MKTFYPAGPFSWQKRIKAQIQSLVQLGYESTGTWLDQGGTFTNSDNTTIQEQKTWDECHRLSIRDLQNIADADTLILFEPGTPLERNTRVAEFGSALAMGLQCIVIAPEVPELKAVISNIFVKLKEVPGEWQGPKYNFRLAKVRPVLQYPSFEALLQDVADPDKIDVCLGCGRDYYTDDCGCPAGTGIVYRTKVGKFSVLEPNDAAWLLKNGSALQAIR